MKKLHIQNGLKTLSIIAALIFITANAAGNTTQPDRSKGYITVTDSAGRKVSVPEKVKRIACLYAFTGHVVTMLGRGNDIVAVSNGLKRDSLLLEICPAIKKALVPKTQGAINMEELLRASPDILFMAGDMSGNRGEMEKLARFHIPTIIIDYSDIKSQQQAVRIIGKATGREKEAEKYISFYNTVINKVKSLTDNIPEEKKLRLYYSENEATRTTQDNDLSTDWLKVVGVKNVALNHSENILEGKNFAALEQIIAWNPEVILANEPEAKRLMQEDRKWASIDAVKNSRIYQMPIAISRWGHPGSIETPLAIMWTANKIYPSVFKETDMETETKSYYKTFFDFDLSESKVKKILEGELVRKPKRKTGNSNQ